jgi:hypothetical protein
MYREQLTVLNPYSYYAICYTPWLLIPSGEFASDIKNGAGPGSLG